MAINPEGQTRSQSLHMSLQHKKGIRTLDGQRMRSQRFSTSREKSKELENMLLFVQKSKAGVGGEETTHTSVCTFSARIRGDFQQCCL